MSQKNNEPLSNNLLICKSISNSQKRLLLQKYLQNLFLVTWSKLAQYFSSKPAQIPESDRFQQMINLPQESDLSHHFMDRVDPSVYYTIFFPHQRF